MKNTKCIYIVMKRIKGNILYNIVYHNSSTFLYIIHNYTGRRIPIIVALIVCVCVCVCVQAMLN